MKSKIIIFTALIMGLHVLAGIELFAAGRNDTITITDDSISPSKKSENPDILTPYHLNVIKFNPTPMLLFDELRNVTFSYERLIKKNQSVSLQLGYLVVPQVLNDTLFNKFLFNKDKRKGINLSVDYRIYPFSRNRRPAPDGMYLGGYLSYIGTSSEIQGTLMNAPEDDIVLLEARMNMVNLGFELGYQCFSPR